MLVRIAGNTKVRTAQTARYRDARGRYRTFIVNHAVFAGR